MDAIAERLRAVRERIAAACDRAGRAPGEVELLAVSKTFPSEVVREVAEAGQCLFGENRAQEAVEKIPMLPDSLRWHFIGHLQRNKARKILPLVEAVHSVDSLRLAGHINQVAADLGLSPKVYLEVNIAGEASKHGFQPGDLRASMQALLALPQLEILGLMAVPPVGPDAGASRPWFLAMRALRDELSAAHGVPLGGLSMGMSNDFEVAIEEGSTIVRVGSSIFGRR